MEEKDYRECKHSFRLNDTLRALLKKKAAEQDVSLHVFSLRCLWLGFDSFFLEGKIDFEMDAQVNHGGPAYPLSLRLKGNALDCLKEIRKTHDVQNLVRKLVLTGLKEFL